LYQEKFYTLGSKVTIMARTVAKLQAAKDEISKLVAPEGASIEFVAVDVTKYDDVCKAMAEAVTLQGGARIRGLILAAGRSIPGYFLDQDVKDFRDTMELNYFGCLNCAKAVIPDMIQDDEESHLVFVSSAASIVSFLGYTSYAPTKFAVRALSDGLRNELRGFKVNVHIAYPPDTDTPGFAKENQTKPKETLEISPPEVHSSNSVTTAMMNSLLHGEYHLASPDPIQNLLISASANITPRGKWAVLEILIGPIVALGMLGFKFHADRVAARYGQGYNK